MNLKKKKRLNATLDFRLISTICFEIILTPSKKKKKSYEQLSLVFQPFLHLRIKKYKE